MFINYRRGGIVMLPFVVLGLLIAWFTDAPIPAMLSIALFGGATAIILIVLGKRSKQK